jgi:hypothetical protein
MVEFTIPEWLSSLSSNSWHFFKNDCANHKMAERAGSVGSRGLGQLGHAKAVSSHGGDWLRTRALSHAEAITRFGLQDHQYL